MKICYVKSLKNTVKSSENINLYLNKVSKKHNQEDRLNQILKYIFFNINKIQFANR